MSAAPVSAIVPFYDGHDTLARAVASIVAQTVRPAEIVIVDDGSAVPLHEDQFRDCAVPVRVVRHPQNRGIAAARNTGVLHAREDWLAFLDQDDEWLPYRLELQWAAAAAAGGPATRTVFFGRAVRFANLRTVVWPSGRDVRRMRSGPSALARLLVRGNITPHITLLLHQRLIRGLPLAGFDERCTGGSDDYALVLDLAAEGAAFHGLTPPLAVRHENGNNFSRPESFLSDDIAIIRRITERYPAALAFRNRALASACYRCARGIAAADPMRARELYDEALLLDPLSLRARLARHSLRIGPGAAGGLGAARDIVSAGVFRTARHVDVRRDE